MAIGRTPESRVGRWGETDDKKRSSVPQTDLRTFITYSCAPGAHHDNSLNNLPHLVEFYAKVDIHGWGRVRERPAGNEIGARRGVGSHSFKRDSAG